MAQQQAQSRDQSESGASSSGEAADSERVSGGEGADDATTASGRHRSGSGSSEGQDSSGGSGSGGSGSGGSGSSGGERDDSRQGAPSPADRNATQQVDAQDEPKTEQTPAAGSGQQGSGQQGSGQQEGGQDAPTEQQPAQRSSTHQQPQQLSDEEKKAQQDNRESFAGQSDEEQAPRGKRTLPSINVGDAVWKLASVLATVVRVLCLLFAFVLVARVVLDLVGVNPANQVATFIRGFSDTVVLDFRDLFLPADPSLMMIVNFGLAAVFWIVVGVFVAALIRFLGARAS